MARVDHIGGAGAGPFFHRGLLGTPAEWRLPLGVTQAPLVRRVAQSVILVSVATLVGWVGALAADAHQGQGAWSSVILAGGIGALWLTMVWQLWRGLAQVGLLTLVWGGLPPHRPSTDHKDAVLYGWSVQPWGQRVSVQVVFDLGAWMLLKVSSKDSAHPRVAAWSWLNTRASFQGDTGHHWRALLFNGHANDVGDAQAMRADVTGVVASCGGIQRRWSNLLSSFKKTGQAAGQGAYRREAGAPHAAEVGDDFAATVILDVANGAGRDRTPGRFHPQGARP
jgi:hypothetical protein